MSAIKQLQKRSRRSKIHYACLAAFVVVGTAVSFLEKRRFEGSLASLYFFIALVILGIAMAITSRPYRCPDCGSRLRDHSDHPKARETYLYYCRRCDVIWDSLIQRPND